MSDAAAARTRAVLFDAVGTLIRLREPVGATYARLAGCGDAEALQGAFARHLRQRSPMIFPELAAADVATAEQAWWRALVGDVFAGAGVELPHGAFERLWDHYAGAAAWQPARGAHELLARLRDDGLRTGMVSNFDHRLPAVLAALDLARRLDVVVLPADAGAAKPDARIFALALQRLGVAAGEAVYVGDDAHDDIAGATAAGLRALDVGGVADLRDLPI
ncbi:MAG: HAD-IA family hydrolase [Deltaproteobacteria bacterium]|nr:HAD-IA family hydrolase [Deltaproteobacteria bacterium]